MTHLDIAHVRLHNHHIAGTKLAAPDAVVRWLGAVQSQDYAGAKWAVGQRMHDTTDAALDQAFADGAILRTHVMRPTWHFVAPADIRWLLALTAPRVNATNAYHYRKHGLNDATFARSNAALTNALRGGAQRTRTELASVLQQAGIATNDLRLGLIMMRAELDGVVCSGARRGKQFTYALLDERAPPAETLARDEALAELTRRYMTSHGPATVQDFVWWSGLTMTDAKAGLEMVKPQ
nr:winged helix DNA-binding domain-containing protein [Chloroflexota bacterium]